MRLQDQVVVITGGAGLLGRAFTRVVAQNGGIAIVADVDLDAGGKVVAQVEAEGLSKAEALHLDITSKESVGALIESLHQKYGHIDAIVNNAYPRNRNYGRKFEDIAYEDFCENLNLHLGGYFLVAQQFARYFSEHGGGNIINMASIYGVIPPRFEIYQGTQMTCPAEYAVIKAGIIQFSRYLAQYCKGNGIRVNCLSPGGILDGQPQSFLEKYRKHCGDKGMLETEDICGSLLFLLSADSRYMTGQNLVVDDGFTL